MGFQADDLVAFAKSMIPLPGVSGVWMMAFPDAGAAILWIVVRGFDAEAFDRRLNVRHYVERFIEERELEMRDAGFVFEYQVLIDEEGLGKPADPFGGSTHRRLAWQGCPRLTRGRIISNTLAMTKRFSTT